LDLWLCEYKDSYLYSSYWSVGKVFKSIVRQILNKIEKTRHINPIPNIFIMNYADIATKNVANQLAIETYPVLSNILAA
jgi:hypothetical protein